MSNFLALSVVGLVSGCVYAITATGLVVTYTTTGVFNFAHGAIGMFAAFSYWQLEVAWHWPTVLAIVVVVFVEAPFIGAFVERVLIRTLHSSGGTVETSVTVSLGLLLFLIGAATLIWDPNQPRFLPQFFAGDSVTVLGVNVTYQQMAVLIVTVVVAVVLRVFMYRTRTGTALRAVVDNRELSGLAGASPAYFGQLGWMMGATLAAVAGVLLAALVTLDIQTLTLIVINGYAAAMVGRLRNLPLTFLGGVLLGLAQSYATGYLPVGNLLLSISPVIPMIFLFVILWIIPEAGCRAGSNRFIAPGCPSWGRPSSSGACSSWGPGWFRGSCLTRTCSRPATGWPTPWSCCPWCPFRAMGARCACVS